MRLAITLAATVLALSSCASPPPPPAAPELPLSVDQGSGSQFGNYVTQTDGEIRGPAGERCTAYTWDRPLMAGYAVRLRSASCETPGDPSRMTAIELSRTVIPMSESTIKPGADQPLN